MMLAIYQPSGSADLSKVSRTSVASAGTATVPTWNGTPRSVGEAGLNGDRINTAVHAGPNVHCGATVCSMAPRMVTSGPSPVGLSGVRPTVKRLCAEEAKPVVIQVSEKSRSGMMIRVIDEARMGGAKDVSVASQRS